MKELKKSELRELLKTKSLREIGKIYDVSYERIRQISVKLGLNRRSWQKINVIDDEAKAKEKWIEEHKEGIKNLLNNTKTEKTGR